MGGGVSRRRLQCENATMVDSPPKAATSLTTVFRKPKQRTNGEAPSGERKVYSVEPQGYIDDFYPRVKYLSTINISDTISLKEENKLLQNKIGEVFNGIIENNKYIIYTAVNKIPEPDEAVPSFTFIQENK